MKRLLALLAVFVLVATGCDVSDMITSPRDGAIVSTSTVTVTGKLPAGAPPGGSLVVSGVATPVNPDGTWTAVIPTSAGHVTDIEAVYTDPSGNPWRQRQAVVNGPKLDEGQFSPNGVGLRFTNTGLANLGPVIEDLAGGAFDIGALLLAQRPLIEEDNAFLTIDITGNAYEAGLGGVDIAAQSTSTGVSTNITITDLYIGLALNLSDGLLIDSDCSLELQIPSTAINAKFDFRPDPADPTRVDVNLVGTPTVNTGTVDYEFISGICDSGTFVIGDIVNSVAGGQIQSLVGSAFQSNLGDPDGAGPLDSPVAEAIETALAEISIAGSIGEATKVNLDAPFTQINETSTAIDFRSNADFYSSFGTGPTDCQPPAGAPDLASTYDVPGAYPSLGATTPSGSPYGLGLVISSSAFNQLLGAMTECGILNQDITEISLGGPPIPVTSSVLSLLVPQFATKLPANTPMKIRVTPTVSPFLTSAAGPNGEVAELMLANLKVEFIESRAGLGDIPWLVLAVDAPLGFDLQYDAVESVLQPVITAPPVSEVDARVTGNLVGASEPAMETLFPNLFPNFVSGVSESFAAFPLPSFLGLDLHVVQVARTGNYFVLYANLDLVPQTRIANVAVTDLSSGDSVSDPTIGDANEWRHRIRKNVSSSEVKVDFKGMIGADACCFTGSEERTATGGYRVTLNVIPENGETWRLDMSQLINGAHTLLDEDNGTGETRFNGAVTGRARIGAGAWQNFNVTPSVSSASTSNSGNSYRPFTGTNALVLQGTTAQTITVEFSFSVTARSLSKTFPPVAGDEVAIRIGANETMVNGVTAGEYPGVGNRNIVTDGHFGRITLTTVG